MQAQAALNVQRHPLELQARLQPQRQAIATQTEKSADEHWSQISVTKLCSL